jgi:hypothetical protein
MRSNIAEVVELLSRDRRIELVRRFDHGASGTSLARLNGDLVVIKAWRSSSGREQILDTGLACARIMAGRSVPIPRLLERGTIDGFCYLLYEFVAGDWPPRVDAVLADQMLALLDLQRDAAAQADPGWPGTVAQMITVGDASIDLNPRRLNNHHRGQRILRAAPVALDVCDLGRLRTGDIIHGDFAPENLLVDAGRITAVVDWEQSRTGDVAFDLAGMIFDIELGDKASPEVLTLLYRGIASRVPPDAWRLYTGLYAIRYASWALGTDMEASVLDTIEAIDDHGLR